MIIKSMKFSDFRQFYGENEIKFGSEENNVTLVLGANGNGKTGIFRALMFVLYGDTTLNQDNETSDVHLVNLDKLDENQFSPVDAEVELEFEFKEENYVIKRKLTSIKEEKNIINKKHDPDLFVYGESGDYIPFKKEPVHQFIHRIIEPEIREFFFFDAERMQLLDTTKSEKALSKDIQEGIIRLLQIKYLDKSIDEIAKMIRGKQIEINRQIKDEEIDNKMKEKEEKEKTITLTEIDIGNYRNEKRGITQEIENIKTKLSENSEIKELQEKQEDKAALLNKIEEARSLYKNTTRTYIKQGIHYLAGDIIENNKIFFREYLDKSSDKIPHSLLEESLHDLTCAVCHTDFDEDSDQYSIVKKLLEDYESSGVTNILNSILELNDTLNTQESDYKLALESNLEKLIENKEEMETSEIQIEQLGKEIGDRATNINNLNQLEKQLKQYQYDNEKISENITTNELRLQNLNDELVTLHSDIDQLTEKYERVTKDKSIKEKLKHFKGILEETISEYSSSITKELSHEIYASFINLLDPKDKINYKEVIITENFEIKLLNQLDQNVVQDLSMGQGQIFSLAFILSLAKLASKGRKEINFPLFMDTPFARLSRENRDNLIKNIPSLTNQWILLLTDTEFTNTEKEIFEESNKVGKIYILDNEYGKTTIREFDYLEELRMEEN